MMEPTVTPMKARPRGPTSSKEQGEWHDNVFFDLTRAYDALNSAGADTKRVINLLTWENLFLQQRIKELETQMDNLQSLLDSTQTTKKALLLPMEMTTDLDSYEPKKLPANVDQEYRMVTLPMIANATSKTHLVSNTGDVLIPKELRVGAYPVADNIEDQNIKDAFDATSHQYWQRQAVYAGTSPVQKEECLLTVDLPANIINNLNANAIKLRPFPENSVDIMAVYYNKDVSPRAIQFDASKQDSHSEIVAKGWALLPGFETQLVNNETVPKPTLEAARTRWCFQATAITRLAIILRQRNWVEENGQKVFILGAQEIDVELASYDNAGGYVITPFRPVLPEGTASWSVVQKEGSWAIKHNFLNNDALSYEGKYDSTNYFSKCITYEVYEKLPTGVQLITDLRNLIVEECWIVSTIYPDPVTGCTPVLGSIEVEYSLS